MADKEERYDMIQVGSGGILPSTLGQVFELAELMCRNGMAPKSMRNPQQLGLAMAAGMERGFKPFAAISCVAVINNKPVLHSDGPMALILKSGLMEDFKEEWFGEPYADNFGCLWSVKRHDVPGWFRADFTVDDAKRAELWDQLSTWKKYPKRMLKNRARALALRDGFSDILQGIALSDEVGDGEDPFPEQPLPEQIVPEADIDRAAGAPAEPLKPLEPDASITVEGHDVNPPAPQETQSPNAKKGMRTSGPSSLPWYETDQGIALHGRLKTAAQTMKWGREKTMRWIRHQVFSRTEVDEASDAELLHNLTEEEVAMVVVKLETIVAMQTAS